MILTRKLYGKRTLDEAIGNKTVVSSTASISDFIAAKGIERRILVDTVRKTDEEYRDGLIDLRHMWVPKMMDGTPEQKKEIYDDLHQIIKRLDEFSEQYISAMQLIVGGALHSVTNVLKEAKVGDESTKSNLLQLAEKAKRYDGARYRFDETTVKMEITGQEPRPEIMTVANKQDAYTTILSGFMQIKDLLNLMGEATAPSVYGAVRNTNEFPEARIGKCFEAAQEISRTLKNIRMGYNYIIKNKEENVKELNETLNLLNDIERNSSTKATQWYAALQFHEKPWNRLYNASIVALVASLTGAAYTYHPIFEGIKSESETIKQVVGSIHETLMFLSGAAWTLISGSSVYMFTDAGPKTARWIRKIDDKIFRNTCI